MWVCAAGLIVVCLGGEEARCVFVCAVGLTVVCLCGGRGREARGSLVEGRAEGLGEL